MEIAMEKDDVVANVVRESSSVFDRHAIVPTLTITHVDSNPETDGQTATLNTLTMVGIGDSPADLAKAFLAFVSQKTVPYTDENLRQVEEVIVEIHQRHFAALRGSR